MPSTKSAPIGLPAETRARVAGAIYWTDRALRFLARWGVPAALGYLILSGPILPLIGGGLTPYAGMRSLHVLAGVGLTLAVAYRAAAGVGAGAIWLWAALRKKPRRRIHWTWTTVLLASAHAMLLVMMLWTGFGRYIGQRWGVAAGPWLSATEWGLAHKLLAPYYLATLLIHWFVRSRVVWRSLLDQLRRP
jgi:hypothetical protein